MAAISFGTEYTITTAAPGLVGKAEYSVDSEGNVTMTVYMRCDGNGAWANDPWCAWVNGAKQQIKGRTSGTIGKTWYHTVYSLGKTYSGTIQWSKYNNNSSTTQYSWSIPTPTWNVVVRISNMDAYGNYGGSWVWINENVQRGNSVSYTAYSGDATYNAVTYSNNKLTGNVDTTLYASRKTGYFNLNIYMPDGQTEPYDTGRAGTVQMSTDGGSSWSGNISNEPTNSYYVGRPLRFRNFYPGEGLKYSSVSGVDGNWAVTQDDSVTVNFYTAYESYYLDLNGILDGSSSGSLGDYGRATVVVNGTTVGNQVSDYYAKHPYNQSYSITNITPLSGYRYNGVYSGSTSGTIGLGKTVVLNFSTIEPSNLQINGSATTPFSIDLNWNATGINITNYTVYYNGVAKNCGTSTSTTLEVNPETTYDIYFTATNAGGTTTSSPINITTPADQAKTRIYIGTKNEHPQISGYTPVQYITASSLDQRIELDHDTFFGYEVELVLKWNDITTTQNMGSCLGGYFGVSNGYYTLQGEPTTTPAVAGRQDTVKLVSEFLYDKNEGLSPGDPGFIVGGSTYYKTHLYVNGEYVASCDTRTSSSMMSYSTFHLFGAYGVDEGSTASIYSYTDPYMTLLPYRDENGEPVFASSDGITYRFNDEVGIAGPGFGEWRRGKTYYKLSGKWVKAKKIYRKINNQWIIGTNIEPGDLTFWKQSHSGVWNINYNPTTGLSRIICNGRSGWWEQLYKIYSTTVGATYTVSFDYYNPNGYSADYGGIECQASNALENNNGDARKIGYASLGAAANSEVQRLSFTFTASAAETCIAFNFGRGSDTTPVDIYIGNIFITQN